MSIRGIFRFRLSENKRAGDIFLSVSLLANGRLVGKARARFTSTASRARLVKLFVVDQYRNQITTSMIEHMEPLFRMRECLVLIAEVSKEARDLYLAAGFRVIANRNNVFQMQKDISP